jgi:hypothetical protein
VPPSDNAGILEDDTSHIFYNRKEAWRLFQGALDPDVSHLFLQCLNDTLNTKGHRERKIKISPCRSTRIVWGESPPQMGEKDTPVLIEKKELKKAKKRLSTSFS